MKPKAYSYTRFSSPQQSKGDSKNRQDKGCVAWCKEHNLDLVTDTEYTFFDSGVSAYRGDHIGEKGQLARFLRMVKEGGIERGSYLVVESLDRLGRDDVLPALNRFTELLTAGINIVTIFDSKTYTGKPNTMELMYSIMVMSTAHEESSKKALRLGAKWNKKKEDARTDGTPIGNNSPLWLSYNKQDGYQPILERVAVVQRVFDMTINGRGKAVIAKTLNNEGIQAFKGGSWGASSIDKIINNRSVLGEYQPHTKTGKMDRREPVGEPIADYFPYVIDGATFYAAAAAVQGRRIATTTNQTKNCNVWQGVIKCALCEASMHIVNKGKPPKGNTYLACANARKGICKAKVVRLDRSEEVFKELLTQIDSLALVQDSGAKIGRDLAELNGRLLEQREKLEKFEAALNSNPSVTIAKLTADCEKMIAGFEQEKERLNVELAADKIVDRAHFLDRLDLVSYEGRYRANTLLKRLEIIVEVDRQNESQGGTLYMVLQKRLPIVGFLQTDNEVQTIPLTSVQLEKMREQKYSDEDLQGGEEMLEAITGKRRKATN